MPKRRRQTVSGSQTKGQRVYPLSRAELQQYFYLLNILYPEKLPLYTQNSYIVTFKEQAERWLLSLLRSSEWPPVGVLRTVLRQIRFSVAELRGWGLKYTEDELFDQIISTLKSELASRQFKFARIGEIDLDLYKGYLPTKDDISNKLRAKSSKDHQTGIPSKALRLWRGGHVERLNAVEFINQVYGPAIDAGMTQVDLRRLDPKLYMAFHKWCGRSGLNPRSIIPASRVDPDGVVAEQGGRRPTRAEALAALRTGTEEGLKLFRAYEALGRRERKYGSKRPRAKAKSPLNRTPRSD